MINIIKKIGYQHIVILSFLTIVIIFSLISNTAYKHLKDSSAQLNHIVHHLTPYLQLIIKTERLLNSSHHHLIQFIEQDVITDEQIMYTLEIADNDINKIENALKDLKLQNKPDLYNHIASTRGLFLYYLDEIESTDDVNSDAISDIFIQINEEFDQLIIKLDTLTKLHEQDKLPPTVEDLWRKIRKQTEIFQRQISQFSQQQVITLDETINGINIAVQNLEQNNENYKKVPVILKNLKFYQHILFNFYSEVENDTIHNDTANILIENLEQEWTQINNKLTVLVETLEQSIKFSQLTLAEESKINAEHFIDVSVIGAFTLIIFSWLFISIINQRIKTLSKATNTIASGDYDISIDIQSKDEFAVLAKNFNEMSGHINRQQFQLKTAHQKILNSNVVLEEQVEARTKELQKAKSLAEQASQSKSNFLSSMSHEIRTPMNAIIGLTNLISKSKLNQKQKEQLHKISRASQSLLHIINDILDFSKIEAGKMDLEKIPVNLEEVLIHLGELFRAPCSERLNELNLWIAPGCPKHIYSDPVRLEQILLNLIGNANKFTENGSIEVRVLQQQKYPAETDKQIIVFHVIDTGIGIAQDNIDKLFTAFTQADGTITRKYGGTGLGLSISNKLVQLLGGQLAVESEVNKGSTFSFSIEFVIDHHKADQPHTFPDKVIDKPVLIIDDNKVARIITKTILEPLNLSIELSHSGMHAIQLIREKICKHEDLFELIIIDWLMPDLNGIETAEQILSLYKDHPTPNIIIQTSSPDSKELIDFVASLAKRGACSQLLSKPIKQEPLQQKVLGCLDKEYQADHSEVKEQNSSHQLYRLNGLRVLLVEDNLVNQEVALEALKAEKMLVEVAENGQIALDRLQQMKNSPDKTIELVLMDLQMPVLDGLSATRQLRADKFFKNLPIIALTAHASTIHENECYEAGTNDFISKPFQEKNLINKIMKQYIIAQKLPVLLVEDNEVNQEIIKDMADELNFKCHIASNIEEAKKYFSSVVYDLVLMDLNLPDGNGFDASKSFRLKEQQDGLKRTPIIALTASTNDDDRHKAKQADMDGFMNKPFELEELQHLIMDQVLTEQLSSILKTTSKTDELEQKSVQILNVPVDKKGPNIQKAQTEELSTNASSKNETILDQETLDNLFKKPKLFKRISSVYLENSPGMINELQQAIETSDYEKIGHISHSLKSSSRFIAALELGDLMAEMELQAHEKVDINDIQNIYEKAERNSQLVFAALQQLQ